MRGCVLTYLHDLLNSVLVTPPPQHQEAAAAQQRQRGRLRHRAVQLQLVQQVIGVSALDIGDLEVASRHRGKSIGQRAANGAVQPGGIRLIGCLFLFGT